jgi:acetylornithine deacetylase/succinyl-diaminopimelate desuccinylase-like protein
MEDPRARVREVLPTVLEDLDHLVRIPSVAFPGFSSAPVIEAAELTVEILRASGVANARLMEIPGGYPAVFGEIQAPPDAPTLLLYAHYDVQPAPMAQGWDSDPWVPTTKGGRIYGRGAADDKSGIAIHSGTLRAFSEGPPVGIKILIEGEEETISHLDAFVEANPSLFRCEAFLVADMGNLEVNRPVLTTSLRGEAACTVKVRTLDHPLHSGEFGGPVPDALVALVRMLATLHDDAGNVAVPGLSSFQWEGGSYAEEDFRRAAEMLPSVETVGEGSIGSRLWSKPSINIIGLDAPSVREASNVLIHEATAKVSIRTMPGSDSEHELKVLMDHLVAAAPWNVHVEVERVKAGQPFVCDTSGRFFEHARVAMEEAFELEPREVGCGGTIPLMQTLRNAVPDSEFILWGAEDLAASRIHGSNESVDPAEIERLILAQVLLIERLGATQR